VVAVPVAAAQTVDQLKPQADERAVLYIPEWFGAVGAFYESFDQVSDEEVIALMTSTAGVET
jgi:putative phosphoribosyl transferase